MSRAACLAAALAGLLAAAPAAAQRAPAPDSARTALGFSTGTFVGLTLRVPARGARSWVSSVGWDGKDYLSFQLRRQATRPLPGAPLHGFVAAGAFVGGRDTRAAGLSAGPHGAVGVGFYRGRFEASLEALPGLRVVGAPALFVDAAFGLRVALF